MLLPAEVVVICQAMWEQFGHLMRTSDESQKRVWCQMLAAQLVFVFPAGRWGVKRAGSGRPQSKDTIARNASAGLECWDLFIVGATANPTPNFAHADYHFIPEQIFMPVEAQNHLVARPTPPPLDEEFVAALDRILEGLAGIKEGAEQLRDYLLERG